MMSDNFMYEVVVSRIKLRLRENLHPTTQMFKFRFHGNNLLVGGNNNENDDLFDHNNIQDHHYPKRVSTASYYSIFSALSKFDEIDHESCVVIRRHVLNFTRRRRTKNNNPSSLSIEADIKLVTGSYLIFRASDRDWDDFKDVHRKLTNRPWMLDGDDKDYDVVKYLDNNMSLYAVVPCSDRGVLKAESFTTDEVTQACTCAICLDDFEPCGELAAMMNHVVKMDCGHVFHRECIVSWILSNSAVSEKESNSAEPEPTCPLCRTTMQFLKASSDELN